MKILTKRNFAVIPEEDEMFFDDDIFFKGTSDIQN